MMASTRSSVPEAVEIVAKVNTAAVADVVMATVDVVDTEVMVTADEAEEVETAEEPPVAQTNRRSIC